jgi:hypothetical protein
MALEPRNPGSDATLSEEEAMVTYYTMELDNAPRDEDLTNGMYRNDISNSQKGHPIAGSSQSVCKY